MELIHQYAWIIPMLPCLTAIILGLGMLSFRNGTRSARRLSAILSIGMLFLSMLFAILLFWEQTNHTYSYSSMFAWIVSETVSLQIGYIIDPLTCIMLVLVTSVAILVMIYTDGYMSHDQGYVRFFAYLSLFTASMLGLVLSPNLIQIYAFWELVGMCSYLLIGFWSIRPSAAYACQKAFVTNRIGDFGLLLGILGFYWITGSVDFDTVANRTNSLLQSGTLNIPLGIVCSLLLFLGPVAKSAQFPLHVWLPDAMEGPTPISALIHAATMVAAGIFLVARLLPLFQHFSLVMDTLAWTGGITALLGATIALAQRDLKRGLAYSTMSQLGYMMLALGVGSYEAAIFHLITHAYSKALLFLGSGSVIHGMESVVGYNPCKSQDMSYMGGIRKYMPITGYTFLIGTLSLCGFPPFACFWSKDQILADTYIRFPLLGWVALLTVGLTAFYMCRIYFLTFEGEFRSRTVYSLQDNQTLYRYPKESSIMMVIPLVLLSIPTILIGLIGAPIFSTNDNQSTLIHKWLNLNMVTSGVLEIDGMEFFISALPSIVIAFTGALIAWIIYGPTGHSLRNFKEYLDPPPTGLLGPILKFIYDWSFYRAYIDELYEKLFINSTRILARMVNLFDQWSLDGTVNGVALLTLIGGEGIKYVDKGRISSYIFSLVFFTFLIIYITTIDIAALFAQ